MKKVIESPFADGNATLVYETKEVEFRGSKYTVTSCYYKCDITGEEFTTTEQDELWITQIHNQYREKYGIPYPDEILSMREKYGLSCAKMSKILGFGENQYNLYEKGLLPNESNGKTLFSIQDPKVFRALVENSIHQFTEKEYKNIICKLDRMPQTGCDRFEKRLIFNKIQRSIKNGYVKQDIVKLKNIITFFLNKSGSLCPTKLNKLLFYTDFYHYKEYAKGLSGLEYVAYPYGCVPNKYQTIYDNIGGIEREAVEFANGNIGELLTTKEFVDKNIFSESELNTLNYVYEKYKNYTPKMISDENHKTKAWIENVRNQSIIKYDYSFEIEK